MSCQRGNQNGQARRSKLKLVKMALASAGVIRMPRFAGLSRQRPISLETRQRRNDLDMGPSSQMAAHSSTWAAGQSGQFEIAGVLAVPPSSCNMAGANREPRMRLCRNEQGRNNESDEHRQSTVTRCDVCSRTRILTMSPS